MNTLPDHFPNGDLLALWSCWCKRKAGCGPSFGFFLPQQFRQVGLCYFTWIVYTRMPKFRYSTVISSPMIRSTPVKMIVRQVRRSLILGKATTIT